MSFFSSFSCRLSALCLVLGVAGNAVWGQIDADDLPELGDVASTDLSMQAEKKIGQEIMNEIRRDAAYLDDPEIEAYLNRLGNRLAAASPDAGIGFHFFPVNDPMINAFAMFGGYIGVNAGLVLAVRNESELAGVLAHEISHVTQRHLARGIARQKQISGVTLMAIAAAILAAHSNPDLASATMAGASAGAVQAQLGFSRDFEREADRIGFQILQKAGFDVRGMSSFFSRLQRATRVYENNAPVYLRTHPLSVERISDMQNRELNQPYRQAPDSLEFLLTRARLQAMRGTPDEAVTHFRALLAEQKTLHVAATRYGLAVALARKKDWAAAETTLNALRQDKIASPMIDRLYAESRVRRGDAAGGLAAFREALGRYPDAMALIYGYGEALLEKRMFAEAQTFLTQSLRRNTGDARLYKLQARAYAATGKMGLQHQALAEAYALEGALPAAIEQLELAQRAKDNDFYTNSSIDARLRQLKQKQAEAK
ncbi:MAG: M48 family metalloprotease [Zoogloeaceae bacterium]|jgi:predicted Zn-dependent protease|nr:M48 family metalloprotease [Zoogloeaceae bacterium]